MNVGYKGVVPNAGAEEDHGFHEYQFPLLVQTLHEVFDELPVIGSEYPALTEEERAKSFQDSSGM